MVSQLWCHDDSPISHIVAHGQATQNLTLDERQFVDQILHVRTTALPVHRHGIDRPTKVDFVYTTDNV